MQNPLPTLAPNHTFPRYRSYDIRRSFIDVFDRECESQ